MSAKMPIQVTPCDPGDFDRVVDIISVAFGHIQPIVNAFFPQHDTPAGHIYARDRLLAQSQSGQNIHFLKAVDTNTGEIMGIAKWLVLDEAVKVGKADDAGGLRDKEETEYVQELLEQYFSVRSEAVERSGKLVVLDILAVDPKYQGHGAGSMLVKWGTGLADQMGVDAIVEATVAGRATYEKSGFKLVKEMEFRLADKFPSKPVPQLRFYRRDAAKNGS